MEKVCLTTYIYGEKYQHYIPFLVYSCHKAYPQYDIILFLHEKLDAGIKVLVDKIGATNVQIKECVFSDCPKMSGLKAKSLRWVLWDDTFLNYDYIYVIDIDMLYIKEPTPLHIQHIEHMRTTGLPYDNMARCFTRKPFKLTSLGQRLKYAGVHNIFRFLFGSRIEYRASGLHFIEVKQYYQILTKVHREKYLRMIYDGTYIYSVMFCNNEVFLYNMLKDIGLCPEKMAIQTRPENMLDFNNTTRAEFRPHHGIHLGIFRVQWEPGTNTILESDTYKYYVNIFRREILTDKLFKEIYNAIPQDLQLQFDRLIYYYGLQDAQLQ